ncbi:MAG TPA: hypothetical protein VJN68_16865 [Burkholderiaceae bacterium]|nr:hypothetical protein [Burkholderiaceae bacterium]
MLPFAAASFAMAVELSVIQSAILVDAQQRSRAEAQEVRVVHSDAVTWSDGSLGCPEPGRMYTQALVKGYRIRVMAGGVVLEYHASRNGQWLYCPPGRIGEPAPDDAT